jgi:hypothetical protein
MGVRRQGCRQGNGEWRVGGGVVGGGVWKKCEKLLKKKKKSRQNFLDGNFGGWSACAKKRSPNIPASRAPKLISPYALGGGVGAKFISSPWAQKWLATALCRML